MPTFHTNDDGSGHCAKASLNGRVVAFQLSPTAAQRLMGAGVIEGSRLPNKLLLALIQSGDALTGAEVRATRSGKQGALPFGEGELDTDGILPRCEETGGHIDLHLVVLDDGFGGGRRKTRLLSLEPRHVLRKLTSLSLPVAVLSQRTLDQLIATDKVNTGSSAVTMLSRWFGYRLASAWDELARLRSARQEGLVFDRNDELPLA